MTSKHLDARGFGSWIRFNCANERGVLAGLPRSFGVYCIRTTAEHFRLQRGESDILYIGSAAHRTGLRERVRQYFHPGPTQTTNHRILRRCGKGSEFEIGHLVADSSTNARALERELLLEFIQAHGDLPPENLSLPTRLPLDAGDSRATAHTAAEITCAAQMFRAVSGSPMSLATRTKLRSYVELNDARGLLAFLERSAARRSDVGQSVRRAGLASFESALPEVRRIFASHQLQAKSDEASLLAFVDEANEPEDLDGGEVWILDDLNATPEARQSENASDDEDLFWEDVQTKGLYYDEWLDPEETL